MNAFFKELKQRLQKIGEQDLADDPQVVAIIESPSKTFYITEYSAEKDLFSGYVTGEGIIDDWYFFAPGIINPPDQENQQQPAKAYKYDLLKEEHRISQLVPETGRGVAMARYHKRMQQSYEKRKDQNRDQNPEREH